MAEWMYWMPLLAIPIVLLFRFVGCTSFSATESFDFTLVLEKTAVTVTQGASAQVKVTIKAVGSFANNTTLSMSPLAGVTATISPNPVNPQTTTIDSLLTVTATSAAAVGTSIVTITGKASGAAAPAELVKNASLTINVVAAPAVVPDFSLSLTPTSQTVPAGTPAMFTVNVNRVGGFSEAVTLSSSPGGGTFSPNPATGATSNLIAPTAGAPAGTYLFTVTGTATSGATRTTNGTVVVT